MVEAFVTAARESSTSTVTVLALAGTIITTLGMVIGGVRICVKAIWQAARDLRDNTEAIRELTPAVKRQAKRLEKVEREMSKGRR